MSLRISELAPYLKSVARTPFKWGEHDCLTFTNGAFRAMYGTGWAEDWLGRYMLDGQPMGRDALRAEFGYASFTKAVDVRLTRVEGIPPRGALVTTRRARRWAIGSALGVSVGAKAAFVSKHGIVYHPINFTDKAWVQT